MKWKEDHSKNKLNSGNTTVINKGFGVVLYSRCAHGASCKGTGSTDKPSSENTYPKWNSYSMEMKIPLVNKTQASRLRPQNQHLPAHKIQQNGVQFHLGCTRTKGFFPPVFRDLLKLSLFVLRLWWESFPHDVVL